MGLFPKNLLKKILNRVKQTDEPGKENLMIVRIAMFFIKDPATASIISAAGLFGEKIIKRLQDGDVKGAKEELLNAAKEDAKSLSEIAAKNTYKLIKATFEEHDLPWLPDSIENQLEGSVIEMAKDNAEKVLNIDLDEDGQIG